jgi:uncharacterized protein (TIGR01777 family)
MKVVVAGGTGFLGRRLISSLHDEGHTVTLLTRHAGGLPEGTVSATTVWDGVSSGKWWEAIAEADAVYNFCGASIAGRRWTTAYKKRILDSRVLPTRALARALCSTGRKDAVFMSASAVGFYSGEPEEIADETTPPGQGFLSQTSVQWEEEAMAAGASGVRVVVPRIGIVLDRHAGALHRMLLPFRLFAGGPLGSGKQWMPWIHVDDVIAALTFALANTSLRGPVNVTAPGVVTMHAFASSLGRVLHRPSWLQVPSPVLRVILGEMAELVLKGQRVSPSKLLAAGFVFRYPNLPEALETLCR